MMRCKERTRGIPYNEEDYTKRLKCKKDEIALTEGELTPKTRILIGDLNARSLEEMPENLLIIGGNLSFWSEQFTPFGITSLKNLLRIEGDADFEDSQITSLENLRVIRGNAYFGYSQITDLGELRIIRGNADFRYSQITVPGNLEKIEGFVYTSPYQKGMVEELNNRGIELY